MPAYFTLSPSEIRVCGLDVDSVSVLGKNASVSMIDGSGTQISHEHGPLFFEQTDYLFEVTLPRGTVEARVFTPVASVHDRSVWNAERSILILPMNFGNDLGDFELVFEWRLKDSDSWSITSLSSRVFSFKLDVARDVPIMLKEVNQRTDWIRFDLFRTTLWNWALDPSSSQSDQAWLAVFSEARAELATGFADLTRRHRRRLKTTTRLRPLDRISKVSGEREERLAELIAGRPESRFSEHRKQLDCDIPENRFVKHVLLSTVATLVHIAQRVEPIRRISDVFKLRLREWCDEFQLMARHPFWSLVGNFDGTSSESLVLSQDPLYASIRKHWIRLSHGVSLLDRDLRGGLQNVSQLYEIWCFLQVDEYIRSLVDDDGNATWIFDSKPSRFHARPDDGLEDDDWAPGTVRMTYLSSAANGASLDLLFQPAARRTPDVNYWPGVMSVPHKQIPDIVLRLHRDDVVDSPSFTWIFDAKYRVATDKAGNQIGVPRDAIDDLHRYRDAIVWAADKSLRRPLTQEAIGAFAIYPGEQTNAEKLGVSSVNVGAFTLRPTTNPDEEPRISSHSGLGRKLNSILEMSITYGNNLLQSEATMHQLEATPRPPITGDVLRFEVKEPIHRADYLSHYRIFHMKLPREADVQVSPREWGWLMPEDANGLSLGLFPIRFSRLMSGEALHRLYIDLAIPNSLTKADALCAFNVLWLGNPLSVSNLTRPLF